MNLDVHTLMAVLIIGNMVATLLFLADIGTQEKKFYDKVFVMGKIAQLLGWYMISLRGEISDNISLLLGNMLLVSGEGLEGLALASLKAATMRRWWLLYGGLLAVFCLYFPNIFYEMELKYRIALNMLLLVVFYQVPGAYFLWSNFATSTLQKAVGVMCTLFSLGGIWRAAYVYNVGEYNLYVSDLPHTITFLTTIMMLFGGCIGYILIKKEYANWEITRIANTDFLTGIYNRRAFFHYAEIIMAKVRRDQQPVSFFTIDIDFFKRINDCYGHQAGDKVVKHIAALLSGYCSSNDVICRFGGEEFAVILPGLSGEAAAQAAENMRQAAEELAPGGNAELRVTVSIGVACLMPADLMNYTLDELASVSDQALYQAKTAGRNRVVVKMLQETPGAEGKGFCCEVQPRGIDSGK